MNDTMQKRELVKRVYPNPTWARKVDRMSDEQIIAVFLRLVAQGKI